MFPELFICNVFLKNTSKPNNPHNHRKENKEENAKRWAVLSRDVIRRMGRKAIKMGTYVIFTLNPES